MDQGQPRLDAGQLGLALIMPALGAILTMPFAGRVVSRVGGRTATRVLISLWCLAIILIPLMPNRWLLMVVLLIAGRRRRYQ